MRPQRGTWPWVVFLAVVALGAGIVARLPGLVHIAYLLIGLAVLCTLYVRLSLRALAVEHRVAALRLPAGERLLEVYVVRNSAFWPVLNVAVTVWPGVVRTERRPWEVDLGARGYEEWTAVAVAEARGRYAVGVAALSVADPFGVAVARRHHNAVVDVIVHPQPRLVPGFSLAAARAGDLLPARRSWATMPVAGAVRPFAPGDSSTRIHWLSSARHGLLMVKDSDRSVGQRLWVALDLSSEAHAGLGAESTVEYGVEAAAYVAELAFKAGLDVGLIVTGRDAQVVEPARGRDQRDYLFDVLAVAREGDGEDVATALEEQRTARPSDAVVIVTPAVPLGLLDLCARLRRMGCGIAVVALDASSFGGPPVELDALQGERVPAYTLGRDGA